MTVAEKKLKPETQAERFKRAAREHEADETGAEFDRAFKKIVPPIQPPAERPAGPRSSPRNSSKK